MSEPLLLTFNLDVIGPPQALAECSRCGRTNRWALVLYPSKLCVCGRVSGECRSFEPRMLALQPGSVMRCYHCGFLFSPVCRAENWEPESFEPWTVGHKTVVEPAIWSEL